MGESKFDAARRAVRYADDARREERAMTQTTAEPKKIELTYRPIPFHFETRRWVTEKFDTERELCQRVAELADGPESDFQVNGTWLTAGDIAARLELIERRRTAVALELLCQSQQIYRDDAGTVPDLDMARRVMESTPMLAKGMYRRADQLIAAYESTPITVLTPDPDACPGCGRKHWECIEGENCQ